MGDIVRGHGRSGKRILGQPPRTPESNLGFTAAVGVAA